MSRIPAAPKMFVVLTALLLSRDAWAQETVEQVPTVYTGAPPSDAARAQASQRLSAYPRFVALPPIPAVEFLGLGEMRLFGQTELVPCSGEPVGGAEFQARFAPLLEPRSADWSGPLALEAWSLIPCLVEPVPKELLAAVAFEAAFASWRDLEEARAKDFFEQFHTWSPSLNLVKRIPSGASLLYEAAVAAVDTQGRSRLTVLGPEGHELLLDGEPVGGGERVDLGAGRHVLHARGREDERYSAFVFDVGGGHDLLLWLPQKEIWDLDPRALAVVIGADSAFRGQHVMVVDLDEGCVYQWNGETMSLLPPPLPQGPPLPDRGEVWGGAALTGAGTLIVLGAWVAKGVPTLQGEREPGQGEEARMMEEQRLSKLRPAFGIGLATAGAGAALLVVSFTLPLRGHSGDSEVAR